MSHLPPPPIGLQPLSDAEFRLFQSLIYRETGIFLTDEKLELLGARITRRLRALGLRSFGVYYRRVTSDPQEQARMFDCITTNETHFFREQHQFDFLVSTLLPAWVVAGATERRPRSVRAWSAGCSTGEEPHSLAMTLLDHLPGWSVEILATDLSTRALDAAQSGIWPAEKAEEIPTPYLKRYMLKGHRSQARKMKAGPEIRSVIRFRPFNLNDTDYQRLGRFDLIFCRNVLIYFSTESRKRAIRRLADRLQPSSGYLFVGHAESLGWNAELQNVIPSVYESRPHPPENNHAERAVAVASRW